MGIKERFYDIISISRAIKIKNVPSLLQAVRKLNDKKIYPKTLIIIPVSEMEANIPEKYDLDIVKQYEKLFNYEERKNITLLRLSPELGFLGVSMAVLGFPVDFPKNPNLFPVDLLGFGFSSVFLWISIRFSSASPAASLRRKNLEEVKNTQEIQRET